mmetsp:Transcript_64433/g.172520  ORF Transcript_64433/g.172520 Transcript_64433/m.172520 type:complete len:297 (-) Transcript_64433:418-1308(-)
MAIRTAVTRLQAPPLGAVELADLCTIIRVANSADRQRRVARIQILDSKVRRHHLLRGLGVVHRGLSQVLRRPHAHGLKIRAVRHGGPHRRELLSKPASHCHPRTSVIHGKQAVAGPSHTLRGHGHLGHGRSKRRPQGRSIAPSFVGGSPVGDAGRNTWNWRLVWKLPDRLLHRPRIQTALPAVVSPGNGYHLVPRAPLPVPMRNLERYCTPGLLLGPQSLISSAVLHLHSRTVCVTGVLHQPLHHPHGNLHPPLPPCIMGNAEQLGLQRLPGADLHGDLDLAGGNGGRGQLGEERA